MTTFSILLKIRSAGAAASRRLVPAVSAMALSVLALAAGVASGAMPSAGWSLQSLARPTVFSAADSQDGVTELTVTATSGTYGLDPEDYAPATTVPIEWDATAAELQRALEGSSSIGTGNVKVTRSATEPFVYTITYVGALTAESAGILELVENHLQNGAESGAITQKPLQSPEAHDNYVLTVVNTGDRSTAGQIVVSDKLPAGLVATRIELTEEETNVRGSCSLKELKCTYGSNAITEPPLPPEHELELEITAAVVSPALTGSLTNEASVSGGDAPGEVSTSTTNPVNAGSGSFGISDFAIEADGADGTPSAQAGGHPYSFTTALGFNTDLGSGVEPFRAAGEVKSTSVELPVGLVGDPFAAERCPEILLTRASGALGTREYHTGCPLASRVGTAKVRVNGGSNMITPLYNIIPQPGYPAELGLNAGLGQPVILYAGVVRGASGYRLSISAPSIIYGIDEVEDISVTVFGDPGEVNGTGGSTAFLTNPARCSNEPAKVRAYATSWEGASASREETAYPEVGGCNLLQGAAAFDPSIAVEPETTQADVPSGYVVDLRLPQAPDVFGTLATPELKGATVTLPAGVSVSPSAANGPDALGACAATGPGGINVGSDEMASSGQDLGDPEATELGEGHPGGDSSPYDDGLWHTEPGHCPQNSRLAEVEVRTPLLAEPLHGHLYLASPHCGQVGQDACTEAEAEEGKVFGLYLEVAGSGVIVKLAGSVEAGGYGRHSREAGLAPGQLRARFAENPQFPLEEVRLTFPGGQRAALANPQSCGTATTTSELEPWSAPESGPNATPSSSFSVTGCGSAMPFDPGFDAGTVTPTAGDYSPFVLQLTRQDGEQDLSGLQATLPKGLLAKLTGVPECGEAQANGGTCSAESQIGTVTVTAGAGSEPLEETGRIYLTGPYNGGPYGEVVVVPAIAGPFNLGNVVVRGAIRIDPRTAQATVVSNPFPTIVDGVPVRVRTVDVEVNRPGFTFNPTDCDSQAVTATLTAAQGASATVSSPFAVTDCAALAFKPKFAVSTSGHTSRLGGASLDTTVTYPSTPQGTEANIAKVKVSLPAKLPARLTTLQKACPEQTFAAHPAGCPAASVVGEAMAKTSVLPSPLGGPAYFVSHGGAKYPELVIVLQGDNVTIELHGETAISKKGVLTSTFPTVPDAPFSSFQLKLPEGRYSALTANGANLCKAGKLLMPTELVAQDGAAIHQKTKLKVRGCPKKTKRKAPRKGGRRR